MTLELYPVHFRQTMTALAFVRRLRQKLSDAPHDNARMDGLVVIYGPPLLELTGDVTLYATQGALELAERLALELPTPGAAIALAQLPANVAVIFGRMAR